MKQYILLVSLLLVIKSRCFIIRCALTHLETLKLALQASPTLHGDASQPSQGMLSKQFTGSEVRLGRRIPRGGWMAMDKGRDLRPGSWFQCEHFPCKLYEMHAQCTSIVDLQD